MSIKSSQTGPLTMRGTGPLRLPEAITPATPAGTGMLPATPAVTPQAQAPSVFDQILGQPAVAAIDMDQALDQALAAVGGTANDQAAAVAPQGTTPTQTAAKPQVHTVRPGDTLSKIANKYAGDSQRWRELMALNPQIKNPNLIRPGEKINLPASWAAKPPVVTPAPTPIPVPPPTPAQAALTEAKAMLETTRFLEQNFDRMAGFDGMLAKEDLQRGLPEGPGKAGVLKHFEDLKFQSVDPGRAAWSNLTREDLKQTAAVIEAGVAKGVAPDFAALAQAAQAPKPAPSLLSQFIAQITGPRRR